MWLLQCDGQVLGGKRLWLKPGGKYVIGRASEVNLPVESQKSISRMHLIINVGEVREGDGIKLHDYSTVTLEDLNTKLGTRLDGKEVRGQTKTLTGETHTFHLGKYDYAFRLTWHPVVLSISLSAKERKVKGVMAPYQNKVEALDIKTIATFVPSTTHVVALKRNTAIGLQALINGRYIVSEAYLDAIAQAASITEGEKNSALERDFDANWPKPEKFLPPTSNEPVQRPLDVFLPDEKRRTLFEGYTFVVCEKLQYETFLGPITDAHGKLERFDLDPPNTKAEDLLKFVGKLRGKALVVGFRADTEWGNQFTIRFQEIWGFRMVKQNEFLDIILTLDTAALLKPLEEYISSTGPSQATRSSRVGETTTDSNKNTSAGIGETDPVPEALPQPPADRTRGRTRTRATKAVVDPFAFDTDEFLPVPTQKNTPTTQSLGARDSKVSSAAVQDMSQSIGQPLGTPMEVDESPSQMPNDVLRVSSDSRKRPASPSDNEDDNLDVMDLLPGAQAVKRRKIAEKEERIRRGEPADETSKGLPKKESAKEEPAKPEKPVPKGRGKTGKSQKTEDPYVVKAREIKEKEELAAQIAKEKELAAMEGLEVEQMKNLAIVEVMELKPRSDKPQRTAYGDEGGTWDDKWNGRKNFKKFKRAGGGGGMSTVRGNVMVGLVEHSGRDYGIGDGYWIDDGGEDISGKKRDGKQKSVTQQADSESRDVSPYISARSQQPDTPQPEPETQTQSRRSTRSSTNTQSVSQGTKRAAATQSSRAESKKQKTLVLKDESGSEDDSGDDLKFKFKKKR